MGLINYVKNVIANSNIGATEKALAKDILAYIRSAYVKFNSAQEGTAAVLNAIDAVIGKNYNVTFSKVDSGNVNDADDILEGATLVLESTPRVRFYVKDGADVTEYSFKVGNKFVDFAGTGIETDGSFAGFEYIDIELYAYQMVEDIIIIKGNSTALFHVNYYYDEIAKSGDEALIDLVEKFYNYCYRASVYRTEMTK